MPCCEDFLALVDGIKSDRHNIQVWIDSNGNTNVYFNMIWRKHKGIVVCLCVWSAEKATTTHVIREDFGTLLICVTIHIFFLRCDDAGTKATKVKREDCAHTTFKAKRTTI